MGVRIIFNVISQVEDERFVQAKADADEFYSWLLRLVCEGLSSTYCKKTSMSEHGYDHFTTDMIFYTYKLNCSFLLYKRWTYLQNMKETQKLYKNKKNLL